MEELNLKKCDICGNLVKVINDGQGELFCCGQKLRKVIANSVDASLEKHVPSYKVNGQNIEVEVNHVMEDDHYIMWILFKTNKQEQIIYFKPGDIAKATFPYQKGILYAYCNKHSLWSCEVK